MKRFASIVALAALLVAGTAPAHAMTTRRGELLKVAGHNAIQRRLNQIARLTTRVDTVTVLSSGDRAALVSLLNDDRSGLTALDAKIQSDSDDATLRADLQKIVTGFRIYVLVTPQVHIVIVASREQAFIMLANSFVGKIQRAIDSAKTGGKDVHAAQSALNSMKDELRAASQLDPAGVIAGVLSLTPPGYPGNRSTLLSARSTLVSVRGHLIAARTDAHAAVAALR